MDIMDTARLNIKKHRELKGLRQQDLADKLSINLRSYQNLENGGTKLDLERLEQIAEVLETPIEDLLKPASVIVNQEIQEIKDMGAGFVYRQEISNKLFDKLLASKEEEILQLKEEVKYLKEKVDQLLGLVGKKG